MEDSLQTLYSLLGRLQANRDDHGDVVMMIDDAIVVDDDEDDHDQNGMDDDRW